MWAFITYLFQSISLTCSLCLHCRVCIASVFVITVGVCTYICNKCSMFIYILHLFISPIRTVSPALILYIVNSVMHVTFNCIAKSHRCVWNEWPEWPYPSLLLVYAKDISDCSTPCVICMTVPYLYDTSVRQINSTDSEHLHDSSNRAYIHFVRYGPHLTHFPISVNTALRLRWSVNTSGAVLCIWSLTAPHLELRLHEDNIVTFR
jgi:hypothetical protein